MSSVNCTHQRRDRATVRTMSAGDRAVRGGAGAYFCPETDLARLSIQLGPSHERVEVNSVGLYGEHVLPRTGRHATRRAPAASTRQHSDYQLRGIALNAALARRSSPSIATVSTMPDKPEQSPKRGFNRLAVASAVLAILWIFGIGSLLALVVGRIAERQIRASDQRGDALAGFGIVFGLIGLLVGILILLGWLGFLPNEGT